MSLCVFLKGLKPQNDQFDSLGLFSDAELVLDGWSTQTLISAEVLGALLVFKTNGGSFLLIKGKSVSSVPSGRTACCADSQSPLSFCSMLASPFELDRFLIKQKS
jgi:hypothetical protein